MSTKYQGTCLSWVRLLSGVASTFGHSGVTKVSKRDAVDASEAERLGSLTLMLAEFFFSVSVLFLSLEDEDSLGREYGVTDEDDEDACEQPKRPEGGGVECAGPEGVKSGGTCYPVGHQEAA